MAMTEQAVDPKAIAPTTVDARTVGAAGSGGARSLSVGLVAVAAMAVGIGVGVGIGAGVWTPPAYKPLAWYTAVSVGQHTGVPMTMAAHGIADGFLYVNMTIPRDSVAGLVMTRWDALKGGSLYSTAKTAALFDAYVRGYEEYGEDFNPDSAGNPNASPFFTPRGMRLAAATVMLRTVWNKGGRYI